MARKKKTKVFVSYSRHDEALVKPLAELLGAAANDAVFLDVSSIKPGEFWKNEIDKAIRDASVFIICWCCESVKSTYIAYEIESALEAKGKRLVPVLFCAAPLPLSLEDRQWIDLRGRVVDSCIERIHEAPSEDTGAVIDIDLLEQIVGEARPPRDTGVPRIPMKAMPTRIWLIGVIVALIFVPLGGIFFFGPIVAIPRPSQLPVPDTPEHISYIGLIVFILASLALCFMAAIALKRLLLVLHERSERRQAEKIAATATSYFEGLGKK